MFLSWIAAEIMPHEGEVRRWLTRSFSDAGDAADIVQEAYCRILESGDGATIHNGRAFFYEVARNIALDQLKRRRVVPIDALAELDTLKLRSDDPSPERITFGRQKLGRVKALLDLLPDRCRRVIELRKFHGMSQKEVASHLGISENIVENDAVRGLRLILDRMSDCDDNKDGYSHRRPPLRNRRGH